MNFQKLLKMYEQGVITDTTLLIDIMDCVDEQNADKIANEIPIHLKERFLEQVKQATRYDLHKLIYINCEPLAEEKVKIWQAWLNQK